MHEFDLINNYFSKISKKNKAALNLNDDVFFDKKKGIVISVDTYINGIHFVNFNSPFFSPVFSSCISNTQDLNTSLTNVEGTIFKSI